MTAIILLGLIVGYLLAAGWDQIRQWRERVAERKRAQVVRVHYAEWLERQRRELAQLPAGSVYDARCDDYRLPGGEHVNPWSIRTGSGSDQTQRRRSPG